MTVKVSEFRRIIVLHKVNSSTRGKGLGFGMDGVDGSCQFRMQLCVGLEGVYCAGFFANMCVKCLDVATIS